MDVAGDSSHCPCGQEPRGPVLLGPHATVETFIWGVASGLQQVMADRDPRLGERHPSSSRMTPTSRLDTETRSLGR